MEARRAHSHKDETVKGERERTNTTDQRRTSSDDRAKAKLAIERKRDRQRAGDYSVEMRSKAIGY